MKVKHWQGYGTVEMKKISTKKTSYETKVTIIRVSGNHEWGIIREDIYDVFNWICKRFCKDCSGYNKIVDLQIKPVYGSDIETVDYIIEYEI